MNPRNHSSHTLKIQFVEGSTYSLFRGHGELSRDDIVVAIIKHFPRQLSPNTIWDFSQALTGNISREDLAEIVMVTKVHNRRGAEAKTAFVGLSNETYALVCMYTGLAALAETPVEYFAFRTKEQAKLWIKTGSLDHVRYGAVVCEHAPSELRSVNPGQQGKVAKASERFKHVSVKKPLLRSNPVKWLSKAITIF